VLFVRLIMLLLSILLIVSGLIYINGGHSSLYSFIVAYVTSSIIVLSSFKSYQIMVNRRLDIDSNILEFDDRDSIDKIDDPYGLFDDSSEETDSNISLKEAIKEEKKILKKSRRGLKRGLKDSAFAFNPLRLVAYGIFVLGFFWLLNSNSLSIIYYLIAIAIPNIVIVIYLLNFQRDGL